MNIGILESENFSLEAIRLLNKVGFVEMLEDDRDLFDFIQNKDVLFTRLKTSINDHFISRATSLKFLCSPTTGLNHIDMVAASSRGIQIVSLRKETAFLNTIRATPEHTLGLIISLLRNYKNAFLNESNSAWDRNPYRGFEIYGMDIGIIGMGGGGKLLAAYLDGMGAKIHYSEIAHTKSINDRFTLHPDALSLINATRLIALCADYKEDADLILNRQEIDALKDKYLINTARAELTDEAYIVDLALERHVKGLAVDVIMDEQTTQTNLSKLVQAASLHNVILTPHIGGATYSSMQRTEEFIANKFIQIITP